MESKRKKRRKLKKIIKRILIAVPVVAAVVLVLIFGFRIKSVAYSSDLNQYTAGEIQSYLKEKKVENSLWFWLRSLVGQNKELEMLRDYSITLNSPMKITIKAKEKKLRGSILYGENYFFFDERGVILKSEPCNYKETKKGKKKLEENSLGIFSYIGIEYNGAQLYHKIDTVSEEGFETIINMTEAFEEMEIALEKASEQNGTKQEVQITKVEVSEQFEIMLYLDEGLKVALGKDNQLKEKMDAFVDVYTSTYERLTKYPGTLQMQWLNEDGSYTFIKDEKN